MMENKFKWKIFIKVLWEKFEEGSVLLISWLWIALLWIAGISIVYVLAKEFGGTAIEWIQGNMATARVFITSMTFTEWLLVVIILQLGTIGDKR